MLRHSFAVWSLDSGVPVGDLQGPARTRFLGHNGPWIEDEVKAPGVA